jgi:FkbM family methyltransferase
VTAVISPRRAWRSLRFRLLARRLAGTKLIRAFADTHDEAFFVEIGSNDGVQHDFLRPFILERKWRGIMVEPVPYVFARLRDNYGSLGRVELENAAIADHDGTLPFFHLREAGAEERGGLPGWYDGIGSFDRDVVASHADHIPDIEDRIVRSEVPALTFESLCRKHDVSELDLVLVDTEGYDFEIVRSIDLAARHPRVLVYEHFHLTAEDRERCAQHVRERGYETMEEGFDTWCLDTGTQDDLTATWRGLRPAVPGVSALDEHA